MNSNKILVLYGSETGTAQEVSEGIWRDSKRFGFNGTVMAMDDYDISNLINEPLIIFVCSTTGQGDPPSNMKKFWRFLLRKSLPSNSLMNSYVAVIGLGDSSYEQFNFAAKKLYRRLLALGAKSLLDIGLCDDQHDLGLDAVLNPWCNNLWLALEMIYPHLKEARITADYGALLVRWKTCTSNEPPEKINFPPGEPHEQLTCSVFSNQRVTAEHHFQDVRLITLKPESGSVQYYPGAVAYFRPCNMPSSVEYLLTLIEDVNRVFKLDSLSLPVTDVLKGKVLTIRDVATSYWDLSAIPKRRVFEVLCHVTTSELEREKLKEFLSPGGLDELYNYCNRPRRTTLEVLADFPNALPGLTLDHLFEIFQPIRTRAYSISSSLECDGAVIQILVAVVKYKTRLSTPRFGLATNWLASLTGKVVVAVKPGTLRFPEDSPIIMVGPGTGVAPFRSYISHSIAKEFGKGDSPRQDIILIFGSRYEKCDFHFGEELLKWHSSGKLILITAFSRDQPDKIYVQHKILSEGLRIFEAIYNKRGTVLIAGSSKDMPKAVKESFIEVIAQNSGLSKEEAESYVQKMESSGRYQEETWS